MNEFLKAIYEIVKANNMYLQALETRIVNIENQTKVEPPQIDEDKKK